MQLHLPLMVCKEKIRNNKLFGKTGPPCRFYTDSSLSIDRAIMGKNKDTHHSSLRSAMENCGGLQGDKAGDRQVKQSHRRWDALTVTLLAESVMVCFPATMARFRISRIQDLGNYALGLSISQSHSASLIFKSRNFTLYPAFFSSW